MERKAFWKGMLGTILAVTMAATSLMATGVMAETTGKTVTVNINKADVGELVSLPGIGGAKAEAIVKYRMQNGPFKAVEDLVLVPGIGEKALAGIRDLVRIQ